MYIGIMFICIKLKKRNQMLKLSTLVIAVFVLSACGTSHKTITTKKSIENNIETTNKKEYEVFKILNKINYQHKKITDKNNTHKEINDFLNEKEITILENWKNEEAIFVNFFVIDCIGCSNDIRKFIPIYKAIKGDFIHLGLKKSMGIENLVFKKNGTFVTNFYTFQGYSKNEIKKELRKRGNERYVIESTYPYQIYANKIYLKHIEYSDQSNNGDWYNTFFPMKISYFINLKEKQPVLRFKFNDGFYSYQKNDKMVHFFQPQFHKNSISEIEPKSYISITNGYLGDATFFLILIEEYMNVSIEIMPKFKDNSFNFAIFENNQFHTIDEYLNKKGELYTKYHKKLKKGHYLIRVITKDSNHYEDKLLFKLKILKEKLK